MNDLIGAVAMRNLGFILILVSLLLAWTLVLYRYILQVDEKKVNTEYILKAHIDYLLMGILLIVFSIIDHNSPGFLILLACTGAVTNPIMFVVLAFKPNVNKASFSVFGISNVISFIITTTGFGGLCVTHLLR